MENHQTQVTDYLTYSKETTDSLQVEEFVAVVAVIYTVSETQEYTVLRVEREC